MEQYITFILSILITVAWIWGFEYLFKEGEILGKPGEWMRSTLPDWFLKPTIDCKYCMSSVHGSMFFGFLFSEEPFFSIWWIIFMVCCCGVTAIFDNK